ncbi:zinc finger CCCH domain-containing protein 11B-like isoform X2 [Saccostrea echinata]|uniref:zinc finger CCCH domain-containing protein 11B-like isoform X2 n=1 Tax=Saccostrea echinata TaxID=191078 RepID=UPI002A82E43C|nr:zinc finger CCCH domain-containing protein 11B-like isoform X2 [Saccostrea echinata]
MSAFGSDCHFYYNATCLKGDTCPFRHCEAAKTNDVTCTFWRQKTCIKPNCPYRHSEVVPQTKNRAEIPCYWETQPIGCTKAACPFKHVKSQQDSNTSVEAQIPRTESPVAPDVDVVEVQPVVVNLAEDSDVEMTSPVKSINRDRTAVPDKPIRNLIPKRTPETQQLTSNFVPKHKATITDSKSNIKSRLTNQNPPTENRKSVKERLKLGTSNSGQQNSVKARLGVNKAETSVKNRLGTSQQTTNTEESSPDDSDENSDVEVKSLEQIQREKALRSMGLMELKGGKIVKIADWEKDQRDDSQKSEEETEDKEEESDETEEEEEKEISDEEEDDLTEPEPIELFAPDEVEEDTRTFISTDSKTVPLTSNLDSTPNPPQVEVSNRSRRIVVEDEGDTKTPVLKASLKRRLGSRVTEVARESSQTENEPSVKKRLTTTVGSSNKGTIKTITGIKSRLGTLGDDTVVLDARHKLKQKKMDNIEKITMSIPFGPNKEGGKDPRDSPVNSASVRKRGWRKIKVTEDGTDTDSSRPVTPDRPLSARSSPEKSTVTEEPISQVKRQKKEVDAGEQLQNLLTQKMRNNIWSNRKSKPVGETLDSLGIGIIDIKGGKVVKMSKKKQEENRETKKEDKFLAQIEKLSKGSKKEVRERKVYVPPALQKAGASGLDAGDKRGRISYTESESGVTEEDSNDIQVMTFSEIMAAKSQRQKRLSEKKKAELARKDSVEELPQENTEDSNEAPTDVLKMAQMITGTSVSPVKSGESHHHRSKKKSKWRKKHKSSKEKKDSKENKLGDFVEESTQDTNKSCDTAISEDSQNSNFVSSQHALESVDPVLLKTKRQNSETGGNTSDKEEISPAKKRSEQLLSDSWLDLGEEDSEEVVTQDEDDLLREIDELLA